MDTNERHTPISLSRDHRDRGQGRVWKATSPSNHAVAYKVFQSNPASSDIPLDRQRFISEIHIQSTLVHPGIVPVIEEGVDVNGDPYYVMELANYSLQQLTEANKGGLPLDWTLARFEKICAAMAYAHSQDVLHRDLKPKNILMYGEEPRVADFGLGRNLTLETVTHSQYSGLVGSDGYMAPEQKHDLHEAGKPADVYSLGKILYFMLTGVHPSNVDLNRVPEKVQFLVFKCIADHPGDRFEDCTELLNHVRNVIGGNPSLLAPPTDRLRAALTADAHGEPGALNDICLILLSNPEDSALYMTALPGVHKSVLMRLTHQHPANIKSIVDNFDKHVQDNTTWSYADTIADFLEPIFLSTSDATLRRAILFRLLQQGSINNRFHVGISFAELCESVWGQQMYAEMIADLLRKNSNYKAFFVSYLESKSMPPIVSAALKDPL